MLLFPPRRLGFCSRSSTEEAKGGPFYTAVPGQPYLIQALAQELTTETGKG